MRACGNNPKRKEANEMTRNLKVLGLALVAAMALSAVVASAASAAAAKFTADTVPAGTTATVKGEQSGVNTFTLTSGLTLTCAVATAEGPAVTKGPESTEVSLTPKYETCHVVVAGLTKAVTVTVNGCTYEFNATKNTGGKPFGADLTIKCPAGKQIEIHVYKNKEHVNVECTYDLGHQLINNQIELTNQVVAGANNDDILAHVNATVTLTNTIKNAVCGQSDIETAVYAGTFTLKAFNGVNQVDGTIS